MHLLRTNGKQNLQLPGTDVMILKVFSPKNGGKIGVFDSKQG
jgi:hypothetical protein